MKQFICSLAIFLKIQFLLLLIFCNSSYSQKFYFSQKLYADSNELFKALPDLAKQINSAYYDSSRTMTDDDKSNFYDTAFKVAILAGNYKKSGEFLDSLKKYSEENFDYPFIEFESYSKLKSVDTEDKESFNKAYVEQLKGLYENLNDTKKLMLEFIFDTANITSTANDLRKITDSLKTKNADSISLADAQSLLKAYVEYNVFSRGIPAAMPFLKNASLKILYPVIKSKYSGVFPVKNIDELPDPSLQYNLLVEITSGIKNKKDSMTIKNMNGSFAEVGRLLNLHVASGIPRKNIHVVAVVHASALNSLLTNESYRKKYKIDNPNLEILKELQNAGVKFIACGQAMHFFSVPKEDMIPNVKIALTAQVVLSTYQLRHYVLYSLRE